MDFASSMAIRDGAFVAPVTTGCGGIFTKGSLCSNRNVTPMFSRQASTLRSPGSRRRRTQTRMTPTAMARGSQSMGGDEDSERTRPSKSERNMMKKKGIVTAVSKQLEETDMIFSVPLAGASVKAIYELRNSLPEKVKVMAVKNKLMRRAIEGTQWSIAEGLTTGTNLWFFVDEDNIKSTIVEFGKFLKTHKKNTINGGVLEGVVYDGEEVERIGTLPSKQELYRQIAIGIKGVPTKIAMLTKQIPGKVGRAVHLAFVEGQDSAKAPEAAEAPAE